MSKRDWAREKVDTYLGRFGYYQGLIPDDAAKLLQLERARARRIVRAVQKPYIVLGKQEMYDQVKREICDEILKRLQ